MIGTTQISTTKVANELGVSTHNVGELCTSSNINKWSLHKPVSRAVDHGLTEDDWKDVNYGFNIIQYTNWGNFRNASTKEWNYIRPAGTSASPYRLGDFRGYDQNAECPFLLQLMTPNPTINSTCIFALRSFQIQDLLNWNAFSGVTLQYLNIGFYVPGVGYYPLTDTDQGQTIDSIDSSKLGFTVSSTYFQANRTYQAYLVLTTWDGLNGPNRWYTMNETDAGNWWYLGGVPTSFTTKPEITPDQVVNITLNSGSVSSPQYNFFNNLKFTLNVYNGYSQNVTVECTAKIANVVLSGSSTTTTITVGTQTVRDVTQKATVTTGQFTYNNQFEIIAGAGDRLPVQIACTISTGDRTYTKDVVVQIDVT